MTTAIQYRPTAVAAINVRDFKRSVDWFRETLGFEPEYVVEEIGWGELKTGVPGLTIGVSQVEMGPPPAEQSHAGATVTFAVTDVDAARARLEGMGVVFDGPTNEIPGMVKLATFFDPDGNAFMFSQSLG